MRKLIILAFLLLMPLTVLSGECSSWGCTSTISVLYTNADGPVYVGTPQDETLANCTPVSDVYFSLNPDSENVKEVYSSLLAAYMSGKEISLRVKEGSDRCELAYVVLRAPN